MDIPRKILVVDDEPSVVDYVETILHNWKYETCSCENGSSLMDIVAAEKPDLILLDVMLPDIDGITLCHRLKSNPKTNSIPVIMLTSLTDVTTVHEAILYGASDYVSKPVDVPSLKTKIEKAFKRLTHPYE